ncbi:unnamed protein product [Closterium sp. Yama58-4]|nr:unnamed protein product [Closterium sp. Yama58-4]
MLASPGHSPRHISSPLPASDPPSPPPASKDSPPAKAASAKSLPLTAALTSAANVPSATPRRGERMGPPPAKRPRPRRAPVVLDEDTYIEAIERIVQRDYFPDLPRLQNRLEWLEAVRSGDPVQIREAQVNILRRRAEASAAGGGSSRGSGRGGSSVGGTPRSSLSTPALSAGAPSPAPSLLSEGGLRTSEWDRDEERLTGRRIGSRGRVAGDSATAAAAAAAGAVGTDGVGEIGEGEGGGGPDTSLSLDEFVKRYTSEDNASFVEIKEKDNRRRMAKVAHLLALEQGPGKGAEGEKGGEGGAGVKQLTGSGETVKLLTGTGENEDRKTDGFGSSGQPTSTLETWKYTARNALMYPAACREDAPFSVREKELRSAGPPKEVHKANTRFHGSVTGGGNQAAQQQKQPPEEVAAALFTPLPGGTPLPYTDPSGERDGRKRYDLEDLRRTPVGVGVAGGAGGGGVGGVGRGERGGYEYVATPSPAPGVDASPFMTWGELDGTPLRLDAEDTPVGFNEVGGVGAGGPQFTMAAAPARDEAGVQLSRSAGRSIRERRLRAAGLTPVRGIGGGGGGGGGRGGMMSPFASPGLKGTPGGGGAGMGAWGGQSPSVTGGGGLGGPSGGGLSAAAQKLVCRAMKRSKVIVDPKLRASYSASPAGKRRGTPGSAAAAAAAADSPVVIRSLRGTVLNPISATPPPSMLHKK